MLDLQSKWEDIQPCLDEVNEWTDSIYNKYFNAYFQEMTGLYNRMKSKDHPITDAELEWILTTLPLELFTVSDALSRFKVTEEVIKLKNKETYSAKLKLSSGTTEAKRKAEVDESTMEDRLFLSIVGTITQRVESEMSFCRELIMSAKKIWDARRKQEDTSMLENNIEGEALPEYDPANQPKRRYIM